MKFPFYQQLESNDCGITCIRMICSFYGKDYPLNQIKNECEITKLGITVTDMVVYCEKFGLDCLPIKCEIDKFDCVPLPMILHWKQNHFVVLYKISRSGKEKHYHIADPSYGKIRLSEQEMQQQWLCDNPTGIGILCQPGSHFNDIVLTKENNKINKSLKDIIGKYKSYLGKIGVSTILLILSIVISWIFPMLFQKLVDLGIEQNNIDVIWEYVLVQIVFIVSYILSSNISSIILMKMNFEISTNYLSEYILKIIRLPYKFFDSKIKSEFIQRIEDQARLQNFLSYRIISFTISILSFLVFSFLLLYYSAKIFIVFLILSVISFMWTMLFLKKRLSLDYGRFAALSENRNTIQEILDGMPDIKINNAQQNRLNIWKKTQNRINSISLKSIYLNYYQLIGSSFVDKTRDVVIVAICSLLILKEQSTLGTLLTISYILGQLTYSLSQIYQFSKEFQDAKISLDRLSEIQNKEDENICGTQSISTIEQIKLDSVSFKYFQSSMKFVIDDISLNIPLNKTTAIVGHSGSGKTTLVKILLGFYTPQKGKILINGEDLESIKIDQWRDKCGSVLQDGFIFSSTVAENIALGCNDLDIERVKYAAKIACAEDFINLLPNKYRTKIGNAGVQLSGGQKQRLLIARAVYKNPEILIFDEATSHLDTENERNIVLNLQKYLKNKTIIVIAHRLSTVVEADKIIYLQVGKVVEEGTHETLSKKKGFYYRLIENQLQTN